jgi:hypothetical protein
LFIHKKRGSSRAFFLLGFFEVPHGFDHTP